MFSLLLDNKSVTSYFWIVMLKMQLFMEDQGNMPCMSRVDSGFSFFFRGLKSSSSQVLVGGVFSLREGGLRANDNWCCWFDPVRLY